MQIVNQELKTDLINQEKNNSLINGKLEKENISENNSLKISEKSRTQSLSSNNNLKINLNNSQINSTHSLTQQENYINNFDIDKIDIGYYQNSILNYINKKRKKLNLNPFFENITLNFLAHEISENHYLYKTPEKKENLDLLIKKYKFDPNFEKIIIKFDFLDLTNELKTEDFKNSVIDLLNIIYECPKDLKILHNTNLNASGIGFCVKEDYICLVILASYLPIKIEEIKLSEIGYLEIRGKVLEKNKGLYAVKINYLETGKERLLINYQFIDYNLDDNTFSISYEFDEDLNEPEKYIEFFLKEDPLSIKYGQKCRIKHISKSYSVDLRIPLLKNIVNNSTTKFSFIHYTENNFQKTSKTNFMILKSSVSNCKLNLEKNEKSEISEKIEDAEDEDDGKTKSDISSSYCSDSEDGDDDNHNIGLIIPNNENNGRQNSNSINEFCFDQYEDKEEEEEDEERPDKDLKSELEKAEKEAKFELKIQMEKNRKLQFLLRKIWQKTLTKLQVESNSNSSMNQLKYNNSLALIHQITQELEKINEKYDKTAEELNKRLEEKTNNYSIIKKTFNNLKKEISKKAVYLRNLKKIPKGIIKELEEKEKEVEQLNRDMRITLIKLRMNLEKKKKGLNRKNQFSDGHHLIDFEKFKIENQNLNEKIAERNDEIFKLKKKNHSNIQILAHIMEKLNYENEEILKLSNIFGKLKNEYNEKKRQLPALENELKKKKKKMKKLTQETGIIKNTFLKVDFIKRKKNIEKLKIEKEKLEKELLKKREIIERVQKLKEK